MPAKRESAGLKNSFFIDYFHAPRVLYILSLLLEVNTVGPGKPDK
jgi:hypothetical protein